jgi:head-tail adaptor
MEAARVDADVTHEVRIRYRDDLTPSHRFVFDNDTNRVLNIVSIRNVEERGRELIVMCKEDV